MRRAILMMLLGFWSWQASASSLYKCTDSSGAVLFTLSTSAAEHPNCIVLSSQFGAPTPAPAIPIPAKVEKPAAHFTGTAFAVGESKLLTNQHVVADCSRIRVDRPRAIAEVIAIDKERDLALLDTTARFHEYATFRSNGPITGEDLMIAGYPLTGILGQEMSVTRGIVSSTSVSPSAQWNFSHTAPTQPGNSGGPVFDTRGNVVGVVVGKLDEIRIAQVTGSLPQNVNFGINGKDAMDFLKKAGGDVKVGGSKTILNGATLAARAAKFTVLVHCFE